MIEYDELNGNASCTQARYLAQQRILRGHGFIVKEELSVEQSASTAHVLPLDEINSLWKRKSGRAFRGRCDDSPRYASLGCLFSLLRKRISHPEGVSTKGLHLTKRRSKQLHE